MACLKIICLLSMIIVGVIVVASTACKTMIMVVLSREGGGCSNVLLQRSSRRQELRGPRRGRRSHAAVGALQVSCSGTTARLALFYEHEHYCFCEWASALLSLRRIDPYDVFRHDQHYGVEASSTKCNEQHVQLGLVYKACSVVAPPIMRMFLHVLRHGHGLLFCVSAVTALACISFRRRRRKGTGGGRCSRVEWLWRRRRLVMLTVGPSLYTEYPTACTRAQAQCCHGLGAVAAKTHSHSEALAESRQTREQDTLDKKEGRASPLLKMTVIAVLE